MGDVLHRPLYTPDILINALNNGGDQPLLHLVDGPTLTVREVREETSRFVQALASFGVCKGSRVGLIAPNRPEVIHVAHAVSILGAVYTPLHPMSGLPDHLHALSDAGVELFVFDADRFGARAGEIAAALPAVKVLAFGESVLGPDLTEVAAGFTPLPLAAPDVGPHDVMRLGYSGGTTGKPKTIPSVQRVGVTSLQIMMADWEWPNVPNVLSCAPLSHAGSAMILPTLMKGGTLMVQPGFDPLSVMQAIQDHRINCMMLVPTMIYALLDHPRLDEFDLSSLETIFYGASAMSPVRLQEAIRRIGPVFQQFYGQAECPMAITIFRKHEHDPDDLQRLASCGRPSPWLHVALLDSDGNPVPDGEPGEICCRGPLVMDGYRDNDELTAETFRGGWHHTGDVAVRDPGGFLRIVDRTKDMIVTGGFNVYPREIEDIIAEHPAVSQCAVIGVPHPKWGEAVKAFVVLKPGETVDEADLIAPVAQRKGSFQAPKFVEFIDGIPQTPVGKPDKKALKAREAALVD